MPFDLSIADHVIRVIESSDRPTVAWPLRPFERFLTVPSASPDIEAFVTVTDELPDLPRHALSFDADAGLWRLFSAGEGHVLECRDPLTLAIRSVSTLSSDLRTLHIWTTPTELQGVTGWTPMQVFNPILEIALITVVARKGGCVIHSSGAMLDGCGYLFCGPSGAGKSTLAEWFAERGATVLSDERLILTRSPAGLRMHGTPWVGSGHYAANASGPLTALFTISHGRDGHRLQHPSPGTVIASLLQQTFLPQWDREALTATLAFLRDCVTDTPSGHLTFTKDPSVVDYIRAAQPAGPLVTS